MKLSVFNKSVAVLLSGTAASQAIGILILPVLTRLYSPEEMGVLAIFSAIITVLLTVVCLRLETAIPIQENDEDARNVLALCIQVVAITSSVCLVISSCVYVLYGSLLGDFYDFILYVPLGLAVGGIYISVNGYAIRNKKFHLISKSRVQQAISSSLVQVLGGILNPTAHFLVIGYVFNLGAGLFYLKNKLLNDFRFFRMPDLNVSIKTLKANIEFPKYSVIESLANTAGIQVPLLLIAYSMNVAEAAFLFLAMKIIQAPMVLLGSSIAQVFYSQSSEKYKEGVLPDFTNEVLTTTFKIGVGPIIFIGILAPTIAQNILGDEWSKVGNYILLMTPWFVMQFLASPISPIMYVINQQRSFMNLTLLGFVLKLASVGAAIYSDFYVIEILVASNFIFYTICIVFFCKKAKLQTHVVIYGFLKKLYIPIIWIVFSLLAVQCLNILR